MAGPQAGPSRGPVDPDRLGMDQPSASEPGELHHVDMAGIVIVMPGDEARQHTGIGRLHIPQPPA